MDSTALEAYASLQSPPDELHRPDGIHKKKRKRQHLQEALDIEMSDFSLLSLGASHGGEICGHPQITLKPSLRRR
jgi:hypothetical protein